MKSRLLSVAALALAIAGCGGNEPAKDSSDTATEEPVAPAPVESAQEASPVEEDASPVEEVAVAVAPAIATPASFAQCAVCHVTEAGKASTLGPNLFGIVGRKAGALEGFSYSQGMKNSGLTWDASNLDAFITRPQQVVPGTRMAFGGIANADKRKEIVEFLAKLK